MRRNIIRTGITTLAATVAITGTIAAAADAKPRKRDKPRAAPALTEQQATTAAYVSLLHSPPEGALDEHNWTVETCTLLNRKQAACEYRGVRPYGAPPAFECWYGTGEWHCARPPQPMERCRGWLTVELGWSGAGVVARSEPACEVVQP